jgi:hypothetical protein
MFKEIATTSAIALTLYAFLPYINSILHKKTKPHAFSWFIWGLTTFIVFFAQLEGKAGIGAWPIGLSGLLTLAVAILAYALHSDRSITRIDWIFFLTALLTLPLWFITSDPVWSVIILTLIDLLGFGPTFRKAWHFPNEEKISFFVIFVLRNSLVILALEHYSLTTVLFPAAVNLACLLLIAVIYGRRCQIKTKA